MDSKHYSVRLARNDESKSTVNPFSQPTINNVSYQEEISKD
jgi:hypothetical protein